MPRSRTSSYDADARLPQAMVVLSFLAVVLVTGIVLLVRGLI